MTFWTRLRQCWKQIRSQWSFDPLERCRWVKLPSIRQSRSKSPKDQRARAGEEAAAHYLIAKGYTILHRNLRFAEGELDFVTKSDNTLVFIEVKTRETEQFGSPSLSVSKRKQRRQVAMANRFISLCRLQGVPVRFDVVSVILPAGQPPAIEHTESAFLASDL
jgi:putative endonuclease